ncbi:MAG TPA: M56 family metallopeptidase, partial [Candidatus Binatia bacterium]|nr:M56 family metallopeptidase [Candidatus Binatia bacterium]
MNFAILILPQQTVEALGWTLFHSLWQGTLAALGFAVFLYFSRRTSSRMRYGLGLAVLALMLLASVLTFRNHYHTAGADAAVLMSGTSGSAAMALPVNGVTGPATEKAPLSSQRVIAFFSDYFSRHLPLLVTLWLLGVLFLTLRFTGGMLYLQRLKYKQSRPLPQPWPDRLRELAAKAGLKRPLQLLESLRLRTPVVVGHLKPVLLLPVGLATGLPADEVEALLAHELAHVLRRDYLVNVLQNLVEIIYFFHPGVRWISAGVRQEREHCCDDFAVALCGDARSYARALARLQVATVGNGVPFGGNNGYPEPALAAVGRPQRLLRRIVRLLGGPRLVHDFREGFVSALLLVFGFLGMLKLAAVSGGAMPMAATTMAPAAGTANALAASPYEHVSFRLATNGIVKLSGAGGSGSGAGTWLVDGRDGQVIWYMDLASLAPANNEGSFNEEVPLGPGAYSWYRPSGWKATVLWQNASGNGSWQPLTMFVGTKRRPESRRADEEQLKAEQELREKDRLQAEKDRRLKEGESQQRAQEMASLNENERRIEAQDLQKLEQALAAKSAAELKMNDLEIEKYQAELQAGEMALQARLDKEKITSERQNALARLGQMQAEEQRLRGEEKRLRAEENNFKALFGELVAAGL